MKLRELLQNVKAEEIKGSIEIEVALVSFDSRNVDQNTLFVAAMGTLVNGHDYIIQAIDKGACAIVYEEELEELIDGITYIKVQNTSEALGEIASSYYGNPSCEIQLIGITGTNGKTTIATLLFNLFKALGFKVGLISTIKNVINQIETPSTHTTPDVLTINSLLREMLNEGCDFFRSMPPMPLPKR